MKFRAIGVASSIALAAALATPAVAQDDQEGAAATGTVDAQQEAGRNNEIIVTAEFREARLQDTPIAITAVNAAMLEQRGQTNISQVAAQAPNVTLTPQPQNGGTGLIAYIRGVGQTDFNYALDPGVDSFGQFPAALEQYADLKDTPIVTFCTGGIRCEKAAPLMKKAGFNQVWQLEGGILRYFEEVGGAHWHGNCVVFDDRGALKPDLSPV